MHVNNCNKIFILIGMALLISCGIQPKPTTVHENYVKARCALDTLASWQRPTRHLTYYEALARGVKFNLDYRIKLANNALQMGQLTLAEFAMFPALNVSGSLYTRSNDLATFGITSTGQLTDVLNSTPRTIRSARVAFSWNILDFGLSYVRAKQQSDRYLIAAEESRKQLQQLAQDITTSYWDAYSAQVLTESTRKFQIELARSKRIIARAMLDETIPKENLIGYQQALLEGNRRIAQLQFKYEKAFYDLKRLLSLPTDLELTLAKPPRTLMQVQDLSDLNFRKLDSITLASRPELRGQNYQERVAKRGVEVAVLQSLPGFTFNYGTNYNSNKYMVNNKWLDKSIDVAWNLLNLASLPSSYFSAKDQVKYENLKSMALTLTVLTQTRYAFHHYQNLMKEYLIAKQQYHNALAMYRLMNNRRRANLASDQQVLLAKIRAIATKMDQELLLSDISTAFGELYLSTGYDLFFLNPNLPLHELTYKIKKAYENTDPIDFKHFVDITYDKLFFPKKTRV